jgi:Flp pilus assembly protein TadG
VATRSAQRVRAAAIRFARAERGATAVEFALILLPFCALMFGIFELALLFLVSTTLETATEDAARKIRTGEFQQSAVATKAAFKDELCERMVWISDSCTSDLLVESRTFASFASLAANEAASPDTFDDDDTFDESDTCWSPGQPTDIVLVRTYYRWRLFTPGLNRALQNMGDSTRLITTATAFRNEPYSEALPVGAQC